MFFITDMYASSLSRKEGRKERKTDLSRPSSSVAKKHEIPTVRPRADDEDRRRISTRY